MENAIEAKAAYILNPVVGVSESVFGESESVLRVSESVLGVSLLPW